MQALQYLRKLCAHPLLVLDSSVPSHAAAVTACAPAAASDQDWRAADSSLRALHHAPKLQALRQLLQVLCLCGLEHITSLQTDIYIFAGHTLRHPTLCCFVGMIACVSE